MLRHWVAFGSVVLLIACSSDDGGDNTSSSSSSGTSGSQTSTSTQKFSCQLNGACFKCPTGDAVIACAKDGPSKAGCTSAEASFCGS